MQNIFDYLNWRGDLSFARDSFNEVDNLVMSVLAYVEFDGIVPRETDRGAISLSKVAERLSKKMAQPSPLDNNPFFSQIPGLLIKTAQSIRYKNIKLSGYVNQIDYEQYSR